MSRERRSRRGSASDASQQEGEPPADEVGGESATALLLSKLAVITGQLSELESERAADRARLEEVGAAAAAAQAAVAAVQRPAEEGGSGLRGGSVAASAAAASEGDPAAEAGRGGGSAAGAGEARGPASGAAASGGGGARSPVGGAGVGVAPAGDARAAERAADSELSVLEELQAKCRSTLEAACEAATDLACAVGNLEPVVAAVGPRSEVIAGLAAQGIHLEGADSAPASSFVPFGTDFGEDAFAWHPALRDYSSRYATQLERVADGKLRPDALPAPVAFPNATLNLVPKAEEFERLIPGYASVSVGARAEIAYLYPAVARLQDVLRHVESGPGSISERRAVSLEVVRLVDRLLVERLRAVMRRAAVNAGVSLEPGAALLDVHTCDVEATEQMQRWQVTTLSREQRAEFEAARKEQAKQRQAAFIKAVAQSEIAAAKERAKAKAQQRGGGGARG